MVTVTVDDALAAIRAAFSATPIDPQRAFAEWGTTYTSYAEFKRDAAGKTWQELAAPFLEWHHEALMFLGPSSIGDYLPAYITVVLRGDRGLSALPSFLFGALTRDNPDRFDARFSKLAADQRRAIQLALEALEATWEGTRRQANVTRALDSHWRNSNR
jgi:hypothetical protein